MSEFLVGFSYEAVTVGTVEDEGRSREAVEQTLDTVLADNAYPLIGQSLGLVLHNGSIGRPYTVQPNTETQNGWGHKYLFGASNVFAMQDQEQLPYDTLLYVEASEFDGRSYSYVETAKWVRKGLSRIAGLPDISTFLERNVFTDADEDTSDVFIEVPVNARTQFAYFENSNIMTYAEKEHADVLSELSLPKGLLDLLLTTMHGWHDLQAQANAVQLPLRQRRKS